jgi:hypothetical protein
MKESTVSTNGKLKTALAELLEQIGAKLALCCHREVGNLPSLPRREPPACCADGSRLA